MNNLDQARKHSRNLAQLRQPWRKKLWAKIMFSLVGFFAGILFAFAVPFLGGLEGYEESVWPWEY